MIDRKKLIARLSFAAYFAAAFLVFLLVLFPFDRLKPLLESEFRRRTSLELSVARISPRFFNRFVLNDVVVSDGSGKVLFESPKVKTALSLFGLLRGALSASLKADAYGGSLIVKTDQAPGQQYLLLDASGLDIASYPLLKDWGAHLSGKLGGNFELSGDAGKGRFWVKDLTSRQLKIKGFSVPDLDFEKGWLETEVKGDRLTVKKFELDGRDLNIQAAGDLILRKQGGLNLTVKFKPSEKLAHEQAGILALLKSPDSDGYYQLTIGGLVSEPVPRL